jgi:hypothetical protein
MTMKKSNITRSRHCEERSDVAIHKKPTAWIATGYRPRNDGYTTCHRQAVGERRLVSGAEPSRTERSNPEKISAYSWIASCLAMTDARHVIGRRSVSGGWRLLSGAET